MEHFVKTKDESIADEMRKEGFTELSKEGDTFVFINDAKKNMTFDKKKVIYTDKLCM